MHLVLQNQVYGVSNTTSPQQDAQNQVLPNTTDPQQDTVDKIEMTQNQVYGVSNTTSPQQDAQSQVLPNTTDPQQDTVDKIEMTQDQMDTHIDSGVTNMNGTLDDHQDNPDYDYIS